MKRFLMVLCYSKFLYILFRLKFTQIGSSIIINLFAVKNLDFYKILIQIHYVGDDTALCPLLSH